MPKTAMVDARLQQALPREIWPGRGTACYIRGHARSRRRLRALHLRSDCLEQKLETQVYPDLHGLNDCCRSETPGACLMSGFTALLPIGGGMTGPDCHYRLQAGFAGGDAHEIGQDSIRILSRPDIEKADIPFSHATAGRRCVICMATYEPDADTFRRQIDSIRAQTLDSWHCIVNDDGSSDETVATCLEIIGDDPRFTLFRNDDNVGFYRNFETALLRVPDNVDFVALADQDDDWYPDKLQACLDAFREGVQLVYCDMRIVNEQGGVLAETYWRNRRNNYRDAHVLFLANTVTGAASVFRRDLLEYVLPFPQPVGQVFHDHWIACVARCRGELAYVDRALYDYYQYGDSVIGHCDFEHVSVLDSVTGLVERAEQLPGAGRVKSVLVSIRNKSINIYHNEYLRLHLFARILAMRIPDMDRQARRELTMFAANWRAIGRMLYAWLRIQFAGDTTYNAELRLAASVLAFKAERMLARLFGSRIVKRHCRHRHSAQ